MYSYKINILKISHSESNKFSRYSLMKFVFFLKSSLLFNVFYCFGMFVNKHSRYLKCACLKKWKASRCAICMVFFYMKANVLPDFHICISVSLKVRAFVIFPTSIMVLFEIHQRFKGHFLNELCVSFDRSFE